MKKKCLIITISIICAVVVLVILFFAVVILSGNQISIARCVVTDNGSLYMVYDDRPVKLSFNGDKKYETGDKLLIVHQSDFAESHPEQTRAYFVIKISSGSEKDISHKVIDVLLEIGNCSISNANDVDGSKLTYSTVQVLEKTSDTEESSYRIGVILHGTDFSSVGQIIADKITQEWKTFDSMTGGQKIVSSKLWGIVYIQAETWNECEEEIGFTVNNPLESLNWLNKTGYFGMESTDSDIPVKHIQVTANAAQTTDRTLSEINVISGYNTGHVRVTLTVTLIANTEPFTTGCACKGYAVYEEDTVTIGSGIPMLIITTKEKNNTEYYEEDYFYPTAYWVKDNVLYTLRVFGNETYKAEIQATLDRILGEI